LPPPPPAGMHWRSCRYRIASLRRRACSLAHRTSWHGYPTGRLAAGRETLPLYAICQQAAALFLQNVDMEFARNQYMVLSPAKSAWADILRNHFTPLASYSAIFILLS
ncbi:hypothetical protein, partial [Chromobacterium subtsugae]|uniref:hypothetical protein n=1 Tax=Chromobacterium subtsugae TaxID=251747 RepID=UPI001F440EEF